MMDSRAPDHRAGTAPPFWLALILPPASWFLALNASYFMVSWACRSAAGRVALHGASLLALTATLFAGYLSCRVWRDSGARWPGEGADPIERIRFLSVAGILAAALFAVLIVLQWLVTLFLSPCAPYPQPPLAPTA